MTWAFVGRRWEAPPWPLALNAKQHCHCLTSAAADACAACFSGNQEQKQTAPPPHPSKKKKATHTPHPAPLPPGTAHIHASLPCFSEPLCISRLHKSTRRHHPRGNSHTAGAKARLNITCSHTPDLRGLERVRGQTSGDTQRVHFHTDMKNQRHCSLVTCRLKPSPGTIREISEIISRSQDKAHSCNFPANSLI